MTGCTHAPTGGFVAAPQRPADLPEARARLATWLNEGAAAYIRQSDWGDSALAASDPLTWLPALAEAVAASSVYWVTTGMSSLTDVAARSYRPVQSIRPLCPSGLVVFETPVRVGRYDDACDINLRGFHWSEVSDQRGGVALGFEDVPGSTGEIACGIPFVSHGENVDIGLGDEARRNVVAIVQTLWVLADQRLAQIRTERLDRAARRRCERLGDPETCVQIVDLRRIEHHNGGTDTRDVDWSHRWMVDGHWRNHYYPSEGKHRQIWIAPHVKGPEDKPLVIQERVYRWKR